MARKRRSRLAEIGKLTHYRLPEVGSRASFARRRIAAIMAKASITSETWRCQPCQERVSLWASPSSALPVSKASSLVSAGGAPVASHPAGARAPSGSAQRLGDLVGCAGDDRGLAP